MKLSRRLQVSVLLSTLLVSLILFTSLKQAQIQALADHQLERIIRVQLQIDALSNRLWLLQHYRDRSALDEALAVQAELNKKLSLTPMINPAQRRLLTNLIRLNGNLGSLIRLASQQVTGVDAAQMLQARFTMTMQAMAEDSYRFQLSAMQHSEKQRIRMQSLLFTLLVLSLLSLTLFTLTILRRFSSSLKSLNQGIASLAQGDLKSRLEVDDTDEFGPLSRRFNDMKLTLDQITIKRDQLQYEVEQQTKLLTQQQKKLQFLADHDELTQLMSRHAFKLHMEQGLIRCKRNLTSAAVLYLDLDKFKPINDSHGHSMGDLVLVEIAQRLQQSMRQSDMVARWGGDEFVIWLEPVKSRAETLTVIQKLIPLLCSPIFIDKHAFSIDISLGVSLYPQDGKDANSLLQIADNNMYLAKGQPGSNCYFSARDAEPWRNAVLGQGEPDSGGPKLVN
ncbi:sensor domain-containing diguanylate cyclase [Shewanella salipaludis]|uniref:Diguanylate cyclase n=1 Tax=Shewanella salipaludis TaxID=2723052 RepID=A0A972JL77_9GAMM|nr:sensor domain-containing diguanylate cyclase [Shewanella salipaludis]NMH63786.1 diguanylate cyclase [Shewanella salipaludis]